MHTDTHPLLTPLQPPLVEATAARDAAVSTLLTGLGQQGLAVPLSAGPSDVRSSVQQAVEEARRLPEMPPFVDYSALLADLQQWVGELQASAADVAAAQQEASAATADASSQLAATDATDREGLHRLGWLAEQRPLVEQRLAAVGSSLEAPAGAATAALQQLRQRIEEQCVPALIKPPLAELESERDAAVAALAAEMAQRDLPTVVSDCLQCKAASRRMHAVCVLSSLGHPGCNLSAGSAPAAVGVQMCRQPDIPAGSLSLPASSSFCSPSCLARQTCAARCGRRLRRRGGCRPCPSCLWTTQHCWPTSRAGSRHWRQPALMWQQRSR